MAYNQNIPQPSQALNVSQGDLLGNFQAIYNLIGVNHNNFDDTMTLVGKHKWVSFPNQGSMPVFLTGGTSTTGEQGLYNFIYPKTSANELYVHKQSAGSGLTEVPMTASVLSNVASPSTISNGWTYLPSGILMMWLYLPSIGPTISYNINSSNATFPVFNNILNVQASILNSGGTPNNAVYVSSVNIASGPVATISLVVTQRTSTSTATANVMLLVIGY